MNRILFIAAAVFITAVTFIMPAGAAIREETVSYSFEGKTMNGFLVYNDSLEKQPGVLVVHEWWGQNEYTRRRARMLAELGYAALAVDMYGDGKNADTPEEAQALSGEATKKPETAAGRFQAGMNLLKKQPFVDPERISAIGYCFGGDIVLNMARKGLDLDGVVSFHGGLHPKIPIQKGGIKARLLVLHGQDDKFVSRQEVDAFKAEMDAAGASYKFIEYPGAVHAFTNPEADEYGMKFKIPIAYNELADKNSWEEMKKFLAEVSKK